MRDPRLAAGFFDFCQPLFFDRTDKLNQMMVVAGGKLFDAFLRGVGAQFSFGVDAGLGGVDDAVANLDSIKIGDIFDRVAPGEVSDFFCSNFCNHKTLVPGDDLKGFRQPVLVNPGTENFQYSVHDGPPFPRWLELER
jgi:hypothetical protein